MLNRGRARLVIFGNKLNNAEASAQLISRMNTAYKSLHEMDIMLRAFREFGVQSGQISYTIPIETPSLSNDDQLYIRSVEFHSPGFWEFLGKINPLEVIRVYLNDRHERKKDNEYRNRLEREKIGIENQVQKLQFVREFIDVAGKAGLSDDEIKAIVRDKALIPLANLEVFQDKEMMLEYRIDKHDELE